MFNYTPKQILQVRDFFAQNPKGEVKVNHPGGFPQWWTKQDWYEWFRECLLMKCGVPELNERQRNVLADAVIVKDNKERRIQRRGRNVLRSPQMRRRYPEVNMNMHED